jgi:hypothetical protein
MGKTARPTKAPPGATSTPLTFEGSFKPFFELAKELGLTDEARIQKEIDAAGFENSTVEAVRGEVKAKFRPDIVKKLANPDVKTLRDAYPGDYKWDADPAGSYEAARNRYRREKLEKLDNSDKGNMTEAVVRQVEMPDAAQHVRMTKDAMGKQGVALAKDNRFIDLVDPKTGNMEEVKSGAIGPDDVTQVGEGANAVKQGATIDVKGTPVVPKQHRLRMTSPADIKASRADLVDMLTQHQNELTIVVENMKGETKSITYDGRSGTEKITFLAQASFEAWLGVK